MSDAATILVQLLGAPQVRFGMRVLPFPADHRHQLLAHLAAAGGWVGRDRLAFLFWPDEPPETARRNLRRLLHRVRGLDWLAGLAVEEGRLCWVVPTDVRAFEAAVLGGSWTQALEGYGGPLLEGLEGDGTGEYAAWLLAERERLHGLWGLARRRRGEELERAGDPGGAAALLAPRPGDEFDEELLGRYLAVATRAGQTAQALKAYAEFAGRLHREFGLVPDPATARLARQLGEEQVPLSAPSLPTPATPLVGRELELAEIAHALGRPECRLLTLTGPGGVGKTRIALEAARVLAPGYPGRAAFVPLAALADPERVPAAVAEAVGLTPGSAGPPTRQLIQHLRGSPRLLVLDNYEHLLAGAGFVAELLRECPDLRVLVTSRERLHLTGEWLLPVDGLPVPPDGTPLGEALTYDAARLFVERVTRVRPGYVPGEEDLPHVLAVCRLVGGLPLGLELAAAWVRTVPPREIAAEIAANLDFLTSDARDVAPRHASLRATFEHSWRLLDPAGRAALRQLAVCEGGFRPGAARAVAGAGLPLLAGLVDRSLLRASPSGRFHRHPLLHGYTCEKLAAHPDEEEGARARHAAHFLGLLQNQAGALRGAGQKEALGRLDEDLENVRAAWFRAVAQGQADELGRSAAPLAAYHMARGRYREGAELLSRAEASLREEEPAHRPALCRLWVEGAALLSRLGRHAEAERWAQSGLALARELGEPGAALDNLTLLGDLAWRRGEHEHAAALLEEAVHLAEAQRDRAALADSLNLLGNVALDSGDLAAARRRYEAALDLHRELDNLGEVVRLLNNLGCLAAYQGQPGASVALLSEGVALARDIGLPRLLAQLLSSLAETLHERGDLAGAEAAAAEALELARASGDRRLEGILLVDLGRTATAAGNLDRARQDLRAGLVVLWDLGERPQVLRALARWAEWHLACGEAERAAVLLDLVARHPASKSVDRDPARRMRAELGPAPPDAPAAALPEAVAGLLSLLP